MEEYKPPKPTLRSKVIARAKHQARSIKVDVEREIEHAPDKAVGYAKKRLMRGKKDTHASAEDYKKHFIRPGVKAVSIKSRLGRTKLRGAKK